MEINPFYRCLVHSVLVAVVVTSVFLKFRFETLKEICLKESFFLRRKRKKFCWTKRGKIESLENIFELQVFMSVGRTISPLNFATRWLHVLRLKCK